MTQHPDCEQLAALAEGRVSDEARRDLMVHLDACADCYAVYAATLEDLAEEEDAESEPTPAADEAAVVSFTPQSPKRRAALLMPGVGVLAVAALLVMMLMPQYNRELFQTGVATVHDQARHNLTPFMISGEEALIEPYIGAKTRSGEPITRIGDNDPVLNDILSKPERDWPTARAKLDRGALLLLTGRFPAARQWLIQNLPNLTGYDKIEASCLIILAEYLKAFKTGDTTDLNTAITDMENLHQQYPDVPIVVFNTARLLEYNGREAEATQLFNHFRTLDPTGPRSQWLEEHR